MELCLRTCLSQEGFTLTKTDADIETETDIVATVANGNRCLGPV